MNSIDSIKYNGLQFNEKLIQLVHYINYGNNYFTFNNNKKLYKQSV